MLILAKATDRNWGLGKVLVAHTGLEPVISALRGQRVNQLHQCAVVEMIIGTDLSPSQV
jgi:hypothetical protein